MNKPLVFLTGVMVGSAIGTAFGILYAPREGRHTRYKISYQLSRLKAFSEEIVHGKSDVDKLINKAKADSDQITENVHREVAVMLEEMKKINAKIQAQKER